MSLKRNLQVKDSEIEAFKNNIRCAKYSKLEFNYTNNLSQFIQTKKENENIRTNYEEIVEKYKEELDKNEKISTSLIKYKSNFEEMKNKLKISEDSNFELKSRNKYLEDKINTYDRSITNPPVNLSKNSVKQKENLIIKLKDLLKLNFEKYKSDRKRLESRIFYMDKDYKKLREMIE